MALTEMPENGGEYDVPALSHLWEFMQTWNRIAPEHQAAIEAEINRRLDELILSPNPNWGSVTNTSIEGGRLNPTTGIRGDWTGTVFGPIYQACGQNEDVAGMFFGNVWKRVIIGRTERWYGIRQEPTFPQRGIQLGGKSYFLKT
jgi:hypothetical protein